MEQIIYISTARAEFPSPLMVRQILEVSRRNNARDRLSGLLLVGGRRFLQVLEGPQASLQHTYERIRADERHFAMVELARRHIDGPSFPDWAMGYEQDPRALPPQVERLTAAISDPSLKAQLTSFAQIHGQAA